MKAQTLAEELDHETDEVLLSRYREFGRAGDFEALVRRHEKELYRYLVRYLGNRALADDVFQNTLLQIHLKKALYEDGRPVRPWLYAIATHQAVDALRKAGRRPTVSLDQRHGASGGESEAGALVDLLVNEVPGPLAELQSEERRDWIRKSIDRLPPALKQTLILAYYQDLKYREISEILKIPVGTVKSRLHAALARIQEMAGAADMSESD